MIRGVRERRPACSALLRGERREYGSEQVFEVFREIAAKNRELGIANRPGHRRRGVRIGIEARDEDVKVAEERAERMRRERGERGAKRVAEAQADAQDVALVDSNALFRNVLLEHGRKCALQNAEAR